MRRVRRRRHDLAGGPAAAGPIVDPSTLQPEPPPGAVCRADGPWTICQTTFLVDVVNEPILDFDLPCGTIYETIYDLRGASAGTW
ncbi:MAG: hypothetical protein ACRDQ2_04945, partial [Gaiellales bacterium]